MAEPTETITATPGAPEIEPVQIGLCVGCTQPIYSGDGVVVDTQADRWHPECRTVALRQAKPGRAKSATVAG